MKKLLLLSVVFLLLIACNTKKQVEIADNLESNPDSTRVKFVKIC